MYVYTSTHKMEKRSTLHIYHRVAQDETRHPGHHPLAWGLDAGGRAAKCFLELFFFCLGYWGYFW